MDGVPSGALPDGPANHTGNTNPQQSMSADGLSLPIFGDPHMNKGLTVSNAHA